ncbi:hypothetical protein [Microbulbifer thermotolerans]|uniref:Transcriptional regulator n=1 Tax=Microbulbifer thermotolerans TaxID=252514 RepID=A0A143HL44_MICTH|nr:hypothetical protein [Microbulbifer thermotolerans]AMX02445.1 hypothetical protein A3224_07490 [Microbulbifer thermotolerans]MCX2781191.1 hypothetical protein [Microbulbifer thermotolerans]MCX2803461.1 hypothetical protein [Microbulbifer thermotolerans]MCX2833164.1 hypothetical protein [Microbulbifer thermotolerans]
MKFLLSIRKVVETDLNRDCPFPPDDVEYEAHFEKLISEIESIEEIQSAKRDGNGIYLVSEIPSVPELLSRLKGIFSEEFCYLRLEDAVEQEIA